ncbi:MAG: exodeoxyribonuclease VII small subunit [Anaerovoracaceae bacterium]|nr:exodeoxyribonuclease VII small subunit [Anaerovoracaceae bacterium]
MCFEDAMKQLEAFSEKIRDGNTSLEEAMECYEEGIRCYEQCDAMLKNAEQKIEVFSK